VHSNRDPVSYSAFCRKFGDHYTKAVGSHNWNEEAIERMVADLDAPWQTLRSTLTNQYENATTVIEDLMEWVIQHLGKCPEAYVSASRRAMLSPEEEDFPSC
jgi:hypothetical protein